MVKNLLFSFIFMTSVSITATNLNPEPEDPFLWLEEVEGKRAMEWVESKNTATEEILTKHPEFPAIKQQCLEIFNSKDRIAYPSFRGPYLYNFWQDETAERGLWRRTAFSEYFNVSPVWETMLDIDALCEQENEKWSFSGVDVLYPNYDIGIVKLSRGGSDAVVMREFDLVNKTFIEDGFRIEEAKGDTDWLDRDTLLVTTDFGPGSTTSSGYPRIVKIWKRGTPLSEAKTLMEGEHNDVSVSANVINTPERDYVLVSRNVAFFKSKYFVYEKGVLLDLAIPDDSQIQAFFKGLVLLELKSDWNIEGKNYRQGSLISFNYDDFLKGERVIEVLFEAGDRISLSSVSKTRNHLLVKAFAQGQYDELYDCTRVEGKWVKAKIDGLKPGTLSVVSTDKLTDQYFLTHESQLTPRTLYYVAGDQKPLQKIKSLPAYFDGSDYTVEHYESASSDGTKIPYSVLIAKTAKRDGTNPTLLYGYGGFEISQRPYYSSIAGSCWLSRGGVYVVASIRGGGEFGPEWHRAALKENRQLSYDDFISVSEDLIKRGICSRKTLGIMGGSNGGLLVGVVATQRPDLYNAVVCSVPLLDMKRFNKLLAGASWMAEYGNPDLPEEWAYIGKYSPYHNVSADQQYPKIFFKTTTKDDRVHPAHARKMAAKMEHQGHQVYYFENTEGGHGSGVTSEQRAHMQSLQYSYLLKMLK